MWRKVLAEGWRLKELEPTRELDRGTLEEAARGDWEGWLEIARLPAMVHDVLLAQGRIEAPWKPGQAEACRWVAERDWVYACPFDAEPGEGRWFLSFAGLDTIVDVYLNGALLAQQSNSLVPLRVGVSEHLQERNVLLVHFRTVFDLSGPDPVPIGLVDGDPARPVRRPRQNYSTYLGPHPYYSRVGVYQDVALERVERAEMRVLDVDVSVSEDLRSGRVRVAAEGTSRSEDLRLSARLVAPDGRTVGRGEASPAVAGQAYRAELEIEVRDPELWWPRGYGGQPLYRLEVTLTAEGAVEQRASRTVGFRRITMPEMLHFEVNGRPIRLWGADWVSPDWVTSVWNQDKVERLFEMAEHAHFNAMRVWGVVEAPEDPFYELADRRGILLWQDFTLLPLQPDEASRAACREEAAAMIGRLKHHPSLLMWCGGNEAAMWHERAFGGPGGEWPGRVVAEQDVGEVCRALDPDRFYLPNSPYLGIDANDPKQGDTHGYTNIWYVPGYDDLVFASEDTRIAAPPLHSLERFFAPEDLWPEGYSPVYRHGDQHPWPESWMRYTTSQSWKKTGPVEQFYDATSPGELVYRLGMAAALYYRETVERQRRGRPAEGDPGKRICGGYLAWKYNDSWPQIYGAKVDYFCEPYLTYYALRRTYAPLLLSLEVGAYIWLWVVNDGPEPVEGEVTVQLWHLYENAVQAEIVRRVRAEPDQSLVVLRLDEGLTRGQAGIGTFHRDHFLYACLRDREGNVLARTNVLADIERRITFPPARLEVQLEGDALVLSTDRFARSVFLEGRTPEGDRFGWFFEDNWFDLVPGERKVVRVLGDHRSGQITARAWYSEHATTVQWARRKEEST
jgi:hypothetical protein